MSTNSRLLAAGLLGAADEVKAVKPVKLTLSRPGSCSGKLTLVIGVVDDSGSVIAPGGTDPVSNRYSEMLLALRAVAGACTCRRELAAVLHFDTPYGDVGPERLNRRGLIELGAGLRVPSGGAGTSELGPALAAARRMAAAYPQHEVVLVVFSDFELFDADPAAVMAAVAEFPGAAHACVLGGNLPVVLSAFDEVTFVGYKDPPGSVAKALLGGLALHRKRAKRDGS